MGVTIDETRARRASELRGIDILALLATAVPSNYAPAEAVLAMAWHAR